MSNENQKIWDIIVVGAGASGMMTAITAARRGLSVLILEHMDKPGKKLSATGNGKCNYTNARMTEDCYYGSRKLIHAVLPRFKTEDTLSFFREIGIYPREKNGYYYPNSEQALSVVRVLRAELMRLRVRLLTSVTIKSVEKTKGIFHVHTLDGVYKGKNVVAACGLKASPKLGSDGSFHGILKDLGHSFLPVLPALCGFEAKGLNFRKLAGVRTQAGLTLIVDGRTAAVEKGELQLTDYGVSGIPVFQVSSPAVRALHESKTVELFIDFLPGLSEKEVETELEWRYIHQTEEMFLCGLLNEKLIPVLVKKAGGYSSNPVKILAKLLHACPLTLVTSRGFAYAQVCTGGIPAEEIHLNTLESKLVPGLYFTGELLDADGICGGYNLQWAWATGFIAGSEIRQQKTGGSHD